MGESAAGDLARVVGTGEKTRTRAPTAAGFALFLVICSTQTLVMKSVKKSAVFLTSVVVLSASGCSFLERAAAQPPVESLTGIPQDRESDICIEMDRKYGVWSTVTIVTGVLGGGATVGTLVTSFMNVQAPAGSEEEKRGLAMGAAVSGTVGLASGIMAAVAADKMSRWSARMMKYGCGSPKDEPKPNHVESPTPETTGARTPDSEMGPQLSTKPSLFRMRFDG